MQPEPAEAVPSTPAQAPMPLPPAPAEVPEATPFEAPAPVETPPVEMPVETPPVEMPVETPPVEMPVETPPVEMPVETPPVEPPAANVVCDTPEEEDFSFFLISYEAMARESGSPDGFGGDLGGISGADALCQKVAEFSSPCAANNTWRAFLSTTSEDAIDRIGEGPWYDRLGRTFANTLADLLHDRPEGADPEIVNDLPNEYGVPNHDPDLTGEVDNHQTLTGSGIDGRLWSQEPGGGGGGGFGGGSEACQDGWTAEKATCWDWTSAEPMGCPRVGHSWPRQGSGVNWISVWNEGGCAAGVILEELGGPNGDPTVGSAGGYGGYYCFAIQGD
jgi:hypothetical protein